MADTDIENQENTDIATEEQPKPPKRIDPKDLNSVFSLLESDITKSFLMEMFAVNGDADDAIVPPNTPIKIDPKVIPEGSPITQFKNYKDLVGKETTIGRIIVNLFIFGIYVHFAKKEGGIADYPLYLLVNFVDAAFDAKTMKNADSNIVKLYINSQIDHQVLTDYIDRLQWLGYTSAIFTLPSLDLKTIVPDEETTRVKNKLIADNRDAIENKDVLKFTEIENKVLDVASEELTKKGATGKFIYDSGYNGSWSNNYKVTSVFRGVATKTADPNAFEICLSNLTEGVSKEDIPAHADLAVQGAAGRAIDTQKGGYLNKIFINAFSGVVADKEGSDCGSTRTIDAIITNKNYDNYKFRYIKEGSKLVRLDDDNKDKYLGKVSKFRSPMFCKTQKICNHCLGDMFYVMKIENIGMHIARISTRIMLLSMKAFHNMALKPTEFNLNDYVEEASVKIKPSKPITDSIPKQDRFELT
jgi:hypothetical protein